jgi:hypothetical protein
LRYLENIEPGRNVVFLPARYLNLRMHMLRTASCGIFLLVLLSVSGVVRAQQKMTIPFDFSGPPKKWVDWELALQSQRPDTIYYLNLSNRDLKQIPAEVYRFKNLKGVNLSQNDIARIPRRLNRLDSLKYINLSENGTEIQRQRSMQMLSSLRDMSWERISQAERDSVMALNAAILSEPVNRKVRFASCRNIEELSFHPPAA